MVAERQELRSTPAPVELIARNGVIVLTPEQKEAQLQRIVSLSPDLTLPFQVLQELRKDIPEFAKDYELQFLAYSLFIKNPTLTKIGRIFGVSERVIDKWIGNVEDGFEEEMELFADEIERLEERTSSLILLPKPSSSLWNPITHVRSVLGPELGKLVQVASTTFSNEEICQRTGHTSQGARQQLYIARKKVEKRLPDIDDYTKVRRYDEKTQLAIRMGYIEGFNIGHTWYANKDSAIAYENKLPEYTIDQIVDEQPVRKIKERVSPLKLRQYTKQTIYDKTNNTKRGKEIRLA